MAARSVGIVYSEEYSLLSSKSPKFGNRFAMVMSLINAYGLIKHLKCVKPVLFDSDQSCWDLLKTFHSSEYIEALKDLQHIQESVPDDELSKLDESYFDSFGLTYECPGFPHVFDYSLAAVRGSLAGATALVQSNCQVVINWAGGWHHAKRDEASGFCYLNDIVLAIHKIISSTPVSDPITGKINRILYLDFDLHHGDGVEEAFWYSPRVVTFSVHHASKGFFPGTGTWLDDGTEDGGIPCGAGRGKYSAFNLPLAEGTDDISWWQSVSPVLDMLQELVCPSYIVIQCGADCLVTDPHRIFRLTNHSPPEGGTNENQIDDSPSGYLNALKKVISWNVPTLILGGGGYNFADTARLWTKATALVIEEIKKQKLDLDDEIPEHAYFEHYGPGFELNIDASPPGKQRCPNNVAKHHIRLLKQAQDYASYNGFTFGSPEIMQLQSSE